MNATPSSDETPPRLASPISRSVAYCDQRAMPLSEAHVPLEDRGFMFGEAVYEAMLTRHGVPFAGGLHWRRLARSAQGICIDPARFNQELDAAVQALALAGGRGDGMLYLQVTGGVAPRDHLPEGRSPQPAVYATLRPFDHEALAGLQERGIGVSVMEDPRWSSATFKTTQLLGNVLGKRFARRHGGDEVIFHNRQGLLLEGGSTNLFLVKDGKAKTPPSNLNLLPGITRRLLLDLWPDLCTEARLQVKDLREADEIFMSSTTRPVLPVVAVDGYQIGRGRPGPVTRQLVSSFRKLMNEAWAHHGGAPTARKG